MMATILIGILLAVLVLFILITLIKNRKKGGCGHHCPGCDPKSCAFYREKNKVMKREERKQKADGCSHQRFKKSNEGSTD